MNISPLQTNTYVDDIHRESLDAVRQIRKDVNDARSRLFLPARNYDLLQSEASPNERT